MELDLQFTIQGLIESASEVSNLIKDTLEEKESKLIELGYDSNFPPMMIFGFCCIDFDSKLGKDLIEFKESNYLSHELERYILDVLEDKFNEEKNSLSNKVKICRDKKSGYIYILKSIDFYKIGRTVTEKSRIDGYRTENPHGIRKILFVKVNDYTKAETELLRTFRDKLKKGKEWFLLDKEDIKKARKILKKYED